MRVESRVNVSSVGHFFTFSGTPAEHPPRLQQHENETLGENVEKRMEGKEGEWRRLKLRKKERKGEDEERGREGPKDVVTLWQGVG